MGAFLAWEPTGLRQPPRVSAVYTAGRARGSLPEERRRVTSGCQAFVAMVQTAHLGERDNLALLRTLHWSWFRGIFVQAPMGPTPVVVGKTGFELAVVQVSFIEHDDVVQALTADRTYQPLDVRRLPG